MRLPRHSRQRAVYLRLRRAEISRGKAHVSAWRQGAAVGKLQELLNACGYELDVDNSFGPATQKAWGEYIAAYILKALK